MKDTLHKPVTLGEWESRTTHLPLPPITDEDVLHFAQFKIATEHEPKFREGMRKYKDPIILKDCANEAFQEVWDLVNYLSAVKLQHSRIGRLVEELENEHPHLVNNPHLTQIKMLVDSKPLAQKIKPPTEPTYVPPGDNNPAVGESRLAWIARQCVPNEGGAGEPMLDPFPRDGGKMR